MTLENYALKILADSGCDCYTYGGEYSAKIMDDLKEGYPGGMEFPYIDVANAILEISRPKPIVRKPWRMAFETDDTVDGVDFDSFEAAKADAEDTLVNWMVEEQSKWRSEKPTKEELEDYNYMICNCSVRVDRYNPTTDEYEEYWSPSCEEEEKIGWKEIKEENEDEG